jgi:phospholipid N-methyltransferase
MPDVPSRSRWRDHALILGHFLRHPGTVGTVAPSSARLARQMVHALDPRQPQTVVELGPGTGAFTEAIVPRLGPAGRFLAVEVEPAFVEQLHLRFPAIDVACASAERLRELTQQRGLGQVDHIVSGLPFASLPSATSRGVLDAIQQVLRPGGTFTTFQYVHSYVVPRAVAFRRDVTNRMGSGPAKSLVVWNIPPAFVLSWRR